MSVLRSEGWAVRPSFAPHGPTEPITLLMDETSLTQLAGDPPVAWQIPWNEVTGLRVSSSRSRMSFVALVGGGLYQWRRVSPMSPAQRDAVRAALAARGAREFSNSRRAVALVVAAVVTLASFGGYLGGLVARPGTSSVVRALESLNLSARDVAGTWSSTTLTSASLLATLVPAPGDVQYIDPATTSTAPPQASPFALAGAHFQRCLHVSSIDDRIFGLAGAAPLYQVSSPVYYSSDAGGVQVVSTAQYYDALQNVARDVTEMSRASFGLCFAQAVGDELIGANTGATPELAAAQNLATSTFVKGWSRGGVVTVSLPSLQVPHAHLVAIVEAAGHYEVTIFALVANLARAHDTLMNLANAVLARVTIAHVVSA